MYSMEKFDKSFYDSVLNFREFNIVLKFEDDYCVEKSIMDFLDSLGFRITDNGYKYLVFIIAEFTKSEAFFTNIKNLYDYCAAKYSVTRKSVETSISNSIKTAAKSGKLVKMNNVFNGSYVENGYISTAIFIKTVCHRFFSSRKYDREIHFSV